MTLMKLQATLIKMVLSGLLVANVAPANDDWDIIAPGDFRSPPASARPGVWWHWINGNVTREGITADLEAMARVGIGGATIFNVSGPQGPVAFNSPEWRELVRHAISEAARLGLKLGMLNDAGWTGSGGPWITPELSMQNVTWSEVVVEGGGMIRQILPRPEAVMDYYRDIAVLAFPSREGDGVRLANFAPRFTSSGAVNDESGCFVLPLPTEGTPQYVQIETEHLFAARQFKASLKSRNRLLGALEISEDGENFREVKAFTFRPGELNLQFDRVVSRFYRLRIDRVEEPKGDQILVSNLELTPQYSVENLLGKTLARQLPHQSNETPAPEEVVIRRESIIDLSAKMAGDGTLDWEAPPGRWTIVRLGCTTTGKKNHPAPPAGTGLECDKLSKEAINWHFENLLGRVIAENQELVGRDKVLAGALIESWEVGSQNWTPGMLEEFRGRRGYDMFPLLLAYSGRVIDSSEVTERFYGDLRQTIGDMIAENYAGELRRLLHRHDMDLTIEGCGGPTDESYYAGQADIPMGEMWSWGMDKDPNKRSGRLSGSSMAMASAAHTHGRRIVATEAFTAHIGEAWQAHPGNLKWLGDLGFCGGINRFIFHRYAMQPFLNVAPGMTMGMWGVHYERTQTWWEQSKAWHQYLARCQYMLQRGLFVADVLYLQPEGVPRPIWKASGSDAPPNVRGGFNYDVCNADVILNGMSVKNGRLTLPDGMSYRLLVLPGGKSMTSRLVHKIKELVDAGATVLAGPQRPPQASPSLVDMGVGDADVKKTAAELWPRLVIGKSPAEVLAEQGVKSDFISDPLLRYIHRTTENAEVYFVSNSMVHSVDAVASFRVTGCRPELWWPETGRVTAVPACKERDGVTNIALHLEPVGSVFVVFRKAPAISVPERIVSVEVDGRSLLPDLSKSIHLPSGHQGNEPVQQYGDVEPPPVFDGSRGIIWRSGSYVMKTADGSQRELKVALPPIQEIAGPWHVSFDPKWGPFKAEGDRTAGEFVFEKLEDWCKRPEEAIKHYSGSAVYRKQFNWNPAGEQFHFHLDLGRVAVMTEVRLNGKDLGILWKPPFRVDVTEALKPGANELELKVVNLWVNRLIGDAHLPGDNMRGIDGNTWPEWLLQGKSNPSGRYTWSSWWQAWDKDEPLAESGLLGPVRLHAAHHLDVGPK